MSCHFIATYLLTGASYCGRIFPSRGEFCQKVISPIVRTDILPYSVCVVNRYPGIFPVFLRANLIIPVQGHPLHRDYFLLGKRRNCLNYLGIFCRIQQLRIDFCRSFGIQRNRNIRFQASCLHQIDPFRGIVFTNRQTHR